MIFLLISKLSRNCNFIKIWARDYPSQISGERICIQIACLIDLAMNLRSASKSGTFLNQLYYRPLSRDLDIKMITDCLNFNFNRFNSCSISNRWTISWELISEEEFAFLKLVKMCNGAYRSFRKLCFWHVKYALFKDILF